MMVWRLVLAFYRVILQRKGHSDIRCAFQDEVQ
jgi:hypothetical protein